MGVQSSPEPCRSFNKVDSMTNNVKGASQLRNKPWSNSRKPYSDDEAESRARTFECGDILISRDVLSDDYEKRNHSEPILKKSDHVSRPGKTLEQQLATGTRHESPVLQKKENVSHCSELPVAKSKWGVDLRHVVTRDSSMDDPSSDARQPLYNFRQLPKVQLRSSSEPPSSRERTEGRVRTRGSCTNRASRNLTKTRPRSMCELPRAPTEDVQLSWLSTSADDIDAHCTKKNKELSVCNKFSSFETTQPTDKPVTRRDAGSKESANASVRKHMSLEDLLILDQENLSVDVIETHIEKPKNSEHLAAHKEIEKRPRLSTNKQKNLVYLQAPKKPIVDQCMDNSPPSTGGRSVGILSAEKLNIFGKQTSSHTKRARSLEELLKLDEDNLSIDVISKSNCNGMKSTSLKLSTRENIDSLSSSTTNALISEHNVPTETSVTDNAKHHEIGQVILSQDMMNGPDIHKHPSLHLTTKSRTRSYDSGGTLEYLTKDLTKSNCGKQTQLNGMYPITSPIDTEGQYKTVKATDVHHQNGHIGEMNDTVEKRTKPWLESERKERKERNVTNENTYDVNKIDVYFGSMDSCSEDNVYHMKTKTNLPSTATASSSRRAIATPAIDKLDNDRHNTATAKPKTQNTTNTKPQTILSKHITNGNGYLTSDLAPTGANSGKHVENAKGTIAPGMVLDQTKTRPSDGDSSVPVLASQEPVQNRKAPINRKVGKLIIMAGDERDKQLRLKRANKGQRTTTSKGPSNLEDLRRSHKEGLLLTFMSNELEDDGVVDNFPVPHIVFNATDVGLKSMMHRVKHSVPKSTHFSTVNLVTVHTYPSEESWSASGLPSDEAPATESTRIPEATSEKFPNIKLYEHTYAIDFGSVIQRERERLNTMEKLVTVPRSEKTETVGLSDEESDHFNSHQHQDTGQALLF